MTYQSVGTRTSVHMAASASGSKRDNTPLRYLLGCVATVVSCYAAIVCSLFLLRATDNLPPPLVTNNLCFDEKLQWISRNMPSSPPDLLVFGSSVAWRHFDSQQAIESGLAKHPYNLAFCGARLSQTAFILNYFLSKELFRSPRRVIVMAAPEDFTGCALPEEQVFLQQDADKALFSEHGRLALYLKNIDFVPLVRNATLVKEMRRGTSALDRLEFTKYGDAPLDTIESRGLLYGQISALKSQCFSTLREIARQFAARDIQFTVVLTPIHPRWIAEYDPEHQTLRDLRSRIARVLDGTHGRFLDTSESQLFSESDFTDAVHLRWTAAKRLTAVMVEFAKSSVD